MSTKHKPHPARELLESAHLFASSLTDLLEDKLVREVSRRRLSFAQMQTLQLLNATERNTVSEIALFLGVSNAAASKTVDRLARGKWLRRAEVANDRRSTPLSLTEAGRRVLAAYDAARLNKLQTLFREFSPDDVQRVSRILETLSKRMCERTPSVDDGCSGCEVFFSERCLLRASSARRCTHKRLRSIDKTPRQTAVIKKPGQIHTPALRAAEPGNS